MRLYLAVIANKATSDQHSWYVLSPNVAEAVKAVSPQLEESDEIAEMKFVAKANDNLLITEVAPPTDHAGGPNAPL